MLYPINNSFLKYINFSGVKLGLEDILGHDGGVSINEGKNKLAFKFKIVFKNIHIILFAETIWSFADDESYSDRTGLNFSEGTYTQA